MGLMGWKWEPTGKGKMILMFVGIQWFPCIRGLKWVCLNNYQAFLRVFEVKMELAFIIIGP